jgi:hypothetical protein
VQTGLRNFVLGLAETQLDTAFIGLDRVDRLHKPEADQTQGNKADNQFRASGTGAATARKGLAQLVLSTADQFLKVGRIAAAAWRLGPLAPRSLIVATTIAAAAPWAAASSVLIAPGHQDLFPNRVMARAGNFPACAR